MRLGKRTNRPGVRLSRNPSSPSLRNLRGSSRASTAPGPSSARGQSSMEMLMLVGLSLAFIVPIVLTFFSSSSVRTQTLAQVQANSLAQQMADTAGEVWYQGNGSQKGLLVSYPDYLWNISLSGNAIDRSSPTWRDEFKYKGREITVTLSMEDGTVSQIVTQTPAPVLNGWPAYRPQMALDQPRAGTQGSGHVRPGLVYLVFINQGDYVNITRNIN